MILPRTLTGALLAFAVTLGTPAQQQTANADAFTLQRATEAPGATLKAGAYTIAVVDSLTDRTVVRVDSADGKVHLLLLAVLKTPLSGPAGQPVLWDTKGSGHHALRGFVLSGGKSVEFVYPKADAVALANANHESVVAVDTASEGRPELSKLSSHDMQVVNLWLLTPTRVGPNQAIEAQRFVPVSVRSGTPATSVAAVSPPQPSTPPSTAQTSSDRAATSAAAVRSRARKAPVQTASVSRPASLPQTASNAPEIWLASVLCLLGAAALRSRRDQSHWA